MSTIVIPVGVALLGIAGGWAVQVFLGIYTYGRMTERVQNLHDWMNDEAKPQLHDHEDRLVELEAGRRR